MNDALDAVLEQAAGAPTSAPRFATIAAFRDAWRPLAVRWPSPIDHAIVGGALSDRLGYAFSAGYGAALRRLVPTLGPDTHACLCITEAAGGHPRAIQTALVPEGAGFTLTGAKRWATLAGEGDVLLVAASEGWEGDKNRIRMVILPAATPGIRCVALPPTPFTPEIPHYEVSFDHVRVEAGAVLPGDGYTTCIRPFRTIEDIHVSAAAAAFLLARARAERWPIELGARLAALIVTLRALAAAPCDAPATHIALGGALATLHDLSHAAGEAWSATDPLAAARWHRDAPLLRIAEKARATRLTAAWTATR
ncbi:MAG: acyl-CoA dehydrogenase family protein [Pseudomonadota bacterium]|nr:acyl-CoA dehydrogenase family protein [Pseudomonadota bacterium]